MATIYTYILYVEKSINYEVALDKLEMSDWK